jgi:tetratricopeptide (TPR) repeat protein
MYRLHRAVRNLARGTAGLVSALVLLAACSGGNGGGLSEKELASRALQRGLSLHKQGKLDDAAAQFRHALALDPGNKFAHFELGVVDQMLGKTGPAEREFRAALALDPKYIPALYNLAILVSGEGSKKEAIRLYRQIIDIDTRYALAHLNLGLELEAIGQKKKGRHEISVALRLDPSLANQSQTGGAVASPSPTA